ncbi:MAG: 30S ribosomal protein S6 [Microgenomates group bacterium]
MNSYELTLVFDGKSGSGKKAKVTETLKKLLDVFKGKIVESKDWGVKDLTYKIGKSTSGLFLFFELELDPKGVKSLNDKLRVDGDIIRYLLIRKDK